MLKRRIPQQVGIVFANSMNLRHALYSNVMPPRHLRGGTMSARLFGLRAALDWGRVGFALFR